MEKNMEGNFFDKINSHYNTLTKSEIDLYKYIISNINISKKASITELSKLTNMSISTISRFSKKLGYCNFQDMKNDLLLMSNHIDNNYFEEIKYDNSVKSICTSIFKNNISLLESTLKACDFELFEKASSIINNSKKCGIFGLGGSSIVCSNLYHRFLRTSVSLIYSQDYHLQLMNASKMSNDDCAIVVSYSGMNKDMLRIINLLKKNETYIILITGNIESEIARKSDLTISSISNQINFKPESFSSMVVQITISDALFTIYSLRYEKNKEVIQKIRKTINSTRDI